MTRLILGGRSVVRRTRLGRSPNVDVIVQRASENSICKTYSGFFFMRIFLKLV